MTEAIICVVSVSKYNVGLLVLAWWKRQIHKHGCDYNLLLGKELLFFSNLEISPWIYSATG